VTKLDQPTKLNKTGHLLLGKSPGPTYVSVNAQKKKTYVSVNIIAK
jgi:hypothetical protein